MHTRLLFSSLHYVGPFFKSEISQLLDRIDAKHAPHSCQPAPNHAELNAYDQK